uniref:Apple domain-containing protein n=1 Tax=Heterorhabditis bacteriophora TaxID=37862 RepID=A0A1I7WM55_HETBA
MHFLLHLILKQYEPSNALDSFKLKSQRPCNSFYVRWPRVRLNFKAVANARLSLRACESACSLGEDPVTPGHQLECAAINHHPSPDGFSHQCDVFQPHQLQNVDGYVEADDRFSFYWKYCLNCKCGYNTVSFEMIAHFIKICVYDKKNNNQWPWWSPTDGYRHNSDQQEFPKDFPSDSCRESESIVSMLLSSSQVYSASTDVDCGTILLKSEANTWKSLEIRH